MEACAEGALEENYVLLTGYAKIPDGITLAEIYSVIVLAMEINGEPWFVGKDVAQALGYSNVRKAVPQHVDEEDKARTQIGYAGQVREITIINESGLYSLILFH